MDEKQQLDVTDIYSPYAYMYNVMEPRIYDLLIWNP